MRRTELGDDDTAKPSLLPNKERGAPIYLGYFARTEGPTMRMSISALASRHAHT
jgi:hypothetical protein